MPDTLTDFLKAQRARYVPQLTPSVTAELRAMAALEGAADPVPVVESLLNRLEYLRQFGQPQTITQMLHGGFYGPINRGELPGMVTRINANADWKKKYTDAINEVFDGSNLIKGATDQGLPTDPNGQWPGGRITRGGNVFNDWGGGPGGHNGAAQFRIAQQSMKSVSGEPAPTPIPTPTPTPAPLPDPYLPIIAMLKAVGKWPAAGQIDIITAGNITVTVNGKVVQQGENNGS